MQASVLQRMLLVVDCPARWADGEVVARATLNVQTLTHQEACEVHEAQNGRLAGRQTQR